MYSCMYVYIYIYIYIHIYIYIYIFVPLQEALQVPLVDALAAIVNRMYKE